MVDDATHPVVARARELIPLIESHKAHSEEHRALHPEVVDACADAGLFRLVAPSEAGGPEAPLHDAFQAVEIIAAADPAVSWYLTNSNGVSILTARMTPDLREKVCSTDRNFGFSAAMGAATPAKGGYLLSGTWPLMTGVSDADWAMVMGRVKQGDTPPEVRMFVIPTSVLDIEPIWNDAVAMRGTGSHRVSTKDTFVEEGLSFSGTSPNVIDRPMSRIGLALAPMALNNAVVVGTLDAAVTTAAEIIGTRVSTISGAAAHSNAAVLELLSAARNAVWTLRAGGLLGSQTAWQHATNGTEIPTEVRAAMLSAPFYSVSVARQMISELYSRSSSAAFFAGHPLEKSLRDIHAISYGFEPLRNLDHDSARVAAGVAPIDASRWDL